MGVAHRRAEEQVQEAGEERIADPAQGRHRSGLDGLQDALWDQHAAQCGFCIPGMVMSLRELLDRDPTPEESEVRSWLAGNLCRCTGYAKIYVSVEAALGGPKRKKRAAAAGRSPKKRASTTRARAR